MMILITNCRLEKNSSLLIAGLSKDELQVPITDFIDVVRKIGFLQPALA